jgi:hypothetical protein
MAECLCIFALLKLHQLSHATSMYILFCKLSFVTLELQLTRSGHAQLDDTAVMTIAGYLQWPSVCVFLPYSNYISSVMLQVCTLFSASLAL